MIINHESSAMYVSKKKRNGVKLFNKSSLGET